MSEREATQVVENQDTAAANPSPSFLMFWGMVGVGLDWRCAFESFAEKSPFYSEIVLGRALLIVLGCAGASLLAVAVTRTRRRDAWPLFSILSIVVYRLLIRHWGVPW
jgi:hypothetical protein